VKLLWDTLLKGGLTEGQYTSFSKKRKQKKSSITLEPSLVKIKREKMDWDRLLISRLKDDDQRGETGTMSEHRERVTEGQGGAQCSGI